ncbi:GNAT family N-acetyltransferase [Halomonas cerina]|uniref:RimJ/RimL family protein N-acetyltransferase n=1 Tax=Halomonas cerina TaxID=447424 RepID=A0A839VAF1_9GAMM|nr:RimJ/RimL family protein N-acetyltransferase [Halomonas cerina]
MEPRLLYSLAADAILMVHAAFVVFVILGLALTLIGKRRAWQWVRNPWFRLTHLVAIGVVVLQAWLGALCPLTAWEMALREKAGDVVYTDSFIAYWLHRLLYYQAPAWLFLLVYTLFGGLVLLSWIWIRPRPFGRQGHRDAKPNQLSRREAQTHSDVLEAPGVHLRPTQPSDFAFVCTAESAPENRRNIELWSRADHLACIDREDCSHLIIEDDEAEPVGYVILQGLTSAERDMLLRRIVITRKGEGIGRRAVEAIIRLCFDTLGFRRLWLEVHADNTSARQLYERLGFRVETVHQSDTAPSAMVRMALLAGDHQSETPPEPPASP